MVLTSKGSAEPLSPKHRHADELARAANLRLEAAQVRMQLAGVNGPPVSDTDLLRAATGFFVPKLSKMPSLSQPTEKVEQV